MIRSSQKASVHKTKTVPEERNRSRSSEAEIADGPCYGTLVDTQKKILITHGQRFLVMDAKTLAIFRRSGRTPTKDISKDLTFHCSR